MLRKAVGDEEIVMRIIKLLGSSGGNVVLKKGCGVFKAELGLFYLIPGLGLLLSELKAMMPPRELGKEGGLAYAKDDRWALSPCAGSRRGDQGFPWQPKLAPFSPITKAPLWIKGRAFGSRVPLICVLC